VEFVIITVNEKADRDGKGIKAMSNLKPFVLEVPQSEIGSAIFDKKLEANCNYEKYIKNYPVIYVINEESNKKYSVYVGETNNIKSRTSQHLTSETFKSNGGRPAKFKKSKLFIIGHQLFNKSLTLDIENRLMQYLSSVDAVEHVYNRRANAQGSYYTVDKLDDVFSEIWQDLRKRNKDLFPLESIIKDSAIFKASPFHKLSLEQYQVKDDILLKTKAALNLDVEGELILVEGEAGTGKTVLMSSLFYDLHLQTKEAGEVNFLSGKSIHLLVNHDQQLKVYDQIAIKLGIKNKDTSLIVSKPTTFINHTDSEEKVDIVLIDEAHLLWTQGKQSYRGKNQLEDILARAKVVIAIFDKNQILSTESYLEDLQISALRDVAHLKGNLIQLKQQFRINAEDATVQWIRDIVDKAEIANIPFDKKGYEVKIFKDPEKMFDKVKTKAKDQSLGLSRVVATYDWPFNGQKKPEDREYWEVEIDGWKKPWNLQLPRERHTSKNLPWAEQDQTIDEIGSTFTIQGFDLNYAGVIIGPSVKYRDGQIIFDPSGSKNKKATQRRTLDDGKKKEVAEELLKNELNVLLTRGVNGLYIYAVDEALRNVLLQAQKGKL